MLTGKIEDFFGVKDLKIWAIQYPSIDPQAMPCNFNFVTRAGDDLKETLLKIKENKGIYGEDGTTLTFNLNGIKFDILISKEMVFELVRLNIENLNENDYFSIVIGVDACAAIIGKNVINRS